MKNIVATTKTKQEKYDKAFPITSVCRADLESAGFDTANVDDEIQLEQYLGNVI